MCSRYSLALLEEKSAGMSTSSNSAPSVSSCQMRALHSRQVDDTLELILGADRQLDRPLDAALKAVESDGLDGVPGSPPPPAPSPCSR